MKCFKCPNVVCRTEYPEGSVQSVCPKCSWRSSKVKIPTKIPSVKSIPLENTPKSNIFDTIYINNGLSVDSMSQTIIFTLEEDDNFEWVEWKILEEEE